MSTSTVHPKVAAAGAGVGVGAQIAGLLIWALQAHGIDVPIEQVGNVTGVVATIVALLAGWLTPSAAFGSIAVLPDPDPPDPPPPVVVPPIPPIVAAPPPQRGLP